MELSALERAVLDMLLAGDHPSLPALRAQIDSVRVLERSFSGVGVFADLIVPDEVPSAPLPKDSVWLGGVVAQFEGLEHGAGFVVHIANGRLEMLEGYTDDEDWPPEGAAFTLSPASRLRDLSELG